MRSIEKQKLLSLGIRIDPEHVAECVNRLNRGDSTYSLYAHGNDPVSQRVAQKLKRLLLEGKLDFLLDRYSLPLEDIATTTNEEIEAILDNPSEYFGQDMPIDASQRIRYDMVQRAESLAPHKLWTVSNLESCGLNTERALELLTEYDNLKAIRDRSEISQQKNNQNLQYYIRPFRQLTRYLTLLYEMHYRVEHPLIPEEWRKIVCRMYVQGEMSRDQALRSASTDIIRYAVWKGNANREAYFIAIKRLHFTKRAQQKFSRTMSQVFSEALSRGSTNGKA